MSIISQSHWLQNEIHHLLSENFKKNIKIKNLKPIVNQWIETLNQMTPEHKQEQLCLAVKGIETNQELTIQQMTLSLSLLEKIALSRRISSLASQNLYNRRLAGNSNRVITLEGLKTYLSFKYPELPIFYVPNSDILYLKKDECDEILEEKKACWIVFQHDKYLHKTLFLILKQENEKLAIYLFDSSGITPVTQSEDEIALEAKSNFSALCMMLGEKNIERIESIHEGRQIDKVNCGSFILDDLENAMNLLEQKKPLFFKDKENQSQADSSFFTILQSQGQEKNQNTSSSYSKKLSLENDKLGNCKAIMIALKIFEFFLLHSVKFAKSEYKALFNSDTDEEEGFLL